MDTPQIKTVTEAEVVAELARRATDARVMPMAGSVPFIVMDRGDRIEGLEFLMPEPMRKRGLTRLQDEQSFIDYVKQEATDATRIYLDSENDDNTVLVAVIDDHGGAPGWKQYAATYHCKPSIEWKTWTAKDGSPMSQREFGTFLEDNLVDIVRPDAAQVLEVALQLEVKKTLRFGSATRLDNGQVQIRYEETIEGSARNGMLEIPQDIDIAIPVLKNGPMHKIRAKLRYRVMDGGELRLWYDLDRPHKDREHAIEELRKRVAEALGRPVFLGATSYKVPSQ